MKRMTAQEQLKIRIKQKQNEKFASQLRTVMQTTAGRGVFCWLQDVCRVNELSFTGDPHTTAMHEGMRKVGLELIAHTLSLSDGLELKQQAEQEYRQRGNDILRDIMDEQKRGLEE